MAAREAPEADAKRPHCFLLLDRSVTGHFLAVLAQIF